MGEESEDSKKPIIVQHITVGEYTIALTIATITQKPSDGNYVLIDGDGVPVNTTAEKLEKLIADFYYEES